MTAKRGGLGRGVDSLISPRTSSGKRKSASHSRSAGKDSASHASGSGAGTPDITPAQIVNISKVEPNREQPRRHFDEAALQELAESIKTYGILQPLLVQDKGDYYQIIAGERRWRAARLAGLTEVPVIIRDLDDREVMEISLIENIQREDLNPIEEAEAYARLIDEFYLTQEEVASRVSKSRSAITNSMRLLKLQPEVRQMVADGILSAGHARALVTIADPAQQIQLAHEIAEKGLSVRSTERLVRSLNSRHPEKEEADDTAFASEDVIYHNIENQMQEIFGTKVSIHNNKKKKQGKIEIEYYSPDELDHILEMIRSIDRSV